MSFGEPVKFDFARQVAAAIAYVALCGFDRVSVVPFPKTPRKQPGAALCDRSAVANHRFCFSEPGAVDRHGPAQLNDWLRRGAIEARQAGLAVVLSDFLDPAGTRRGSAPCWARVPGERGANSRSGRTRPHTFGDLRLVDAETARCRGHVRQVPPQSLSTNRRQLLQRLREYCQARGINYFMASSGTRWKIYSSNNSGKRRCGDD